MNDSTLYNIYPVFNLEQSFRGTLSLSKVIMDSEVNMLQQPLFLTLVSQYCVLTQ